jgi:uncharacterized membrane protein
MKHLSLKNLILVTLLSAPIIYLKMVYNNLPEKVALHFGADGQPDRYGDKSELWTPILIMMLVALVTYLIVTNIGKIDPKKQTLQSQELMQKLGLTIVCFVSILTMYIVYSSYNSTDGKLVFIMLGLFFAAIGNFMNNIKPNYFVGLRLPWTLENEDNWRKTHHLASKLWVSGGLIIAVLAIFITPGLMSKILVAIIIPMVLIPSVFSYRHYQKSSNKG